MRNFVFCNIDFYRYIVILFANYICALYIYMKSFKERNNTKQLLLIISGLVITPIICSLLKELDFSYYRLVYLVLSSFFLCSIHINKIRISISISFIALGISYIIEVISLFIVSTASYAIGIFEPNITSDLCSAVIQVLLSFTIMRIKRLKNGFSFLENTNYFGIGLIAIGPLIIVECVNKEKMDITSMTIIIVGITLFSIGLFLWIRSAFTRHYRKRLKLRAEEYSKIELAEKAKEIEKLTSENTSLSSIIHLDNHIIQSIETEINKLNNSELTDKLLISINQRNEYVNGTLLKSKNLPSTGNTDIDSVLADLYIKAASRGIDFNLNAECDINYLLNNIITKDDFETLLRNTITTSIVDIENNPDTNGKILITISKPNDIYEFTIMDSGISDDENIKSISEIIENSNASIKTNKFDNNDSFTKSLTIRFDGLKNYTEL